MTDLTTLQAVKAYSALTGNANDDLLQALITAYSDWFRSQVNRSITIATYDIWRHGRERVGMVLPDYPIVAVQLLQIDGRAIPAQTTFGSYGYRIAHNSIVLDGLTFGCGHSNVHIQFTAGYATVPSDIVQAVAEIVGLRFALRGDKQGWTSKSLAGESVSSLNTRDVPPGVKSVINQYKSVVPA